MIHQFWRLSEFTEDNLGVACTGDGLFLGRTPLIERRDQRFVVRERSEIERLLSRAYRTDLDADRLMPSLATVASALSANDQCLARIAAVHLRIPDLPSQAARSAMEAEDDLIKSDWNPALHPRTGTPPNPGWFAPTDGSADESSSAGTAENDDPSQSSDSSSSTGDNWVKLPPGQRNDELGDFLEWLANARPEDERAIRGEIKRYYYDAGDTIGGNALNAALSEILQPDIDKEARQQILDGIAPYADSGSEIDPSTLLLIGAGLLLLGADPPAAAVEIPTAAWQLGWAARGLYFSEQLGADLPATFRTIDSFVDGVATSIKSIDLNAATYQSAARLTSTLNRYINLVVDFDGAELGDTLVESSDISARALSLAVPKGSITAAQQAAIDAARARATTLGVNLIVTQF